MTLGFSTQRCNARRCCPPTVLPFETLCGNIADFDEPDLEIVAVKVAARHCELVGQSVETWVAHVTCHLNRDTEEASAL